MPGSDAHAEEAIRLLDAEMRAEQPSILPASLVLGLVQDALLGTQQPSIIAAMGLEDQMAAYVSRYHELLLQPAAARVSKAKTPQV